VTDPADDYVADFVAGISRLKLVYAHSIMESLDDYRRQSGDDSLDGPCVEENADLDQLIDVAVENDRPMVVVDGAGKRIGIISKTRLLRGIQGGRTP